VWFLIDGVSTAHASAENLCQPVFSKLPQNAMPVSARDQSQPVTPRQLPQHPSRPPNQLRAVTRVMPSPKGVGFLPPGTGDTCGPVDCVPVRRIMPVEFRPSPGNAQFLEQGKVRLGIGLIGIKQRAIPIEEHTRERPAGTHPYRLAETPTGFEGGTTGDHRGVGLLSLPRSAWECCRRDQRQNRRSWPRSRTNPAYWLVPCAEHWPLRRPQRFRSPTAD
jgi:hypothetical protein